MRAGKLVRITVVVGCLAVLAGMLSGVSFAAPGGSPVRYVVVAKSAADYQALRDQAKNAGAKIVSQAPEIRMFVVMADASTRNQLAASGRAASVAGDHVEQIALPSDTRFKPNLKAPGRLGAKSASPSRGTIGDPGIADPAFGYPGLQWELRREGMPQTWNTTLGSPAVNVGVADTGLDFTHKELAKRVVLVDDITQTEDPPLCKTFFGVSDQDLAAQFGGPVTTDWNGHGSWIGGNIAASLDGKGMNGQAPRVNLFALKISQWCGFAFDSEIAQAFIDAANLGVDVVNISFGGYLDRSDPDQNTAYNDYVGAVQYAHDQGTVIAAAAGNEHAKIGAGGLVLSHGILTTPGDPLDDEIGHYEVPGGIPGVVDVSSTGNVVEKASFNCSANAANQTNATCKPKSDPHQPIAPGWEDQLAYYSNYGPRIDVAGEGGARKFNLPVWDRGGTPGFPYTSEPKNVTTDWEDFSITSNWAVEIPCFLLNGYPGFYLNQCYTAIQGTSMAAPHAAGALALIASANPGLRHDVDGLMAALTADARPATNFMRALSPNDTSGGDLTGGSCPTGYCHVDGAAISDANAYGSGVVYVPNP